MNLTSAKREAGLGWKRKATKVVVSDGNSKKYGRDTGSGKKRTISP
jgi:hypothetical protein